MSALERAYADGQLAARMTLKLAWPAATHPVVRGSPVLRSTASLPAAMAPTTTTPQAISQQFDTAEQAETRSEPLRKLSTMRPVFQGALMGAIPGAIGGAVFGDSEHRLRGALGGAATGAVAGAAQGHLNRQQLQNVARTEYWTGQADAHDLLRPSQRASDPHFPSEGDIIRQQFNIQRPKFGADTICTSCRKDKHYGPCRRPIPIPIKRADFNMGMHGEDQSGNSNPSTSPHYSSATSSISALSRAQEGPPPTVQATAAFERMPRETEFADQAAQSASGLDKVSGERRGPSVNPYEERQTRGVPPAGGVGTTIDGAWRSFDTVADSTCIDGGAGTPAGGPVA